MQDRRFTNTPDDPANPTDSRPRPATAPTSDGLRSGIDRGAGHGKVAHPDPAAAPLGTDDEAAGTPPTPEQLRTAAAQEIGRRPLPPAAPDPIDTGRNWLVPAFIAIGIGLLGMILVLTWPA